MLLIYARIATHLVVLARVRQIGPSGLRSRGQIIGILEFSFDGRLSVYTRGWVGLCLLLQGLLSLEERIALALGKCI